MNIRTTCIALAVCAVIHSASFAADVATGPARIVVQNYYYARPGKAEEVYKWRLHASDVRARLGLSRGRVLRRIARADSANLPDVVWECEYASLAARDSDVDKLGKSAEFEQVEQHMDTLIRHFERIIFEVRE